MPPLPAFDDVVAWLTDEIRDGFAALVDSGMNADSLVIVFLHLLSQAEAGGALDREARRYILAAWKKLSPDADTVAAVRQVGLRWAAGLSAARGAATRKSALTWLLACETWREVISSTSFWASPPACGPDARAPSLCHQVKAQRAALSMRFGVHYSVLRIVGVIHGDDRQGVAPTPWGPARPSIRRRSTGTRSRRYR